MSIWNKLKQYIQTSKTNPKKILNLEENENYANIIESKEFPLQKSDVIETEENKRPMENYYRDQEYYTKLLKKKVLEKTLTIERITKKWEDKDGNIT